MKKRIAFLTLVCMLALAGIVSAIMIATLNAPTVNGSTATLSCSGTTGGEGVLKKVEFWTNTTGTWAVNYTKSDLTLALETVTRDVSGIPNGNYNWNCRFFNDTADESVNFTAAANGTFTINVASNTAPSFTGTIANIEFAEDATKSNAFDLDTYFTDAQAMTFRVTGNSSIIISIATDNQVSLTAPANWSGTENMTFIASDGSLTNSSNGVFVNVSAVDDVPYLKEIIPNQTWSMKNNKTIDLSSYFADVESTTLGYTASSVSNIIAYFSGSTVTLSPTSNWTGNTSIIFYANDTKNVATSNTVYLAVQSNASNVNQPPTIDSYKPLLTIVKMKDTESRTFEITKTDTDGNTMTVKWQLNNVDIASATSDKYTLLNPTIGNHTIKVIVSDGSLTTSHSWDVSVRQSISATEVDLSTIAEAAAAPVPSLNIINTTTSKCGDDNQDEGENCATCALDVKCADDEVCNVGICEKKTSPMKAILIVLAIAGAISIGVFLFYRLNTHKETLNAHRGGIIRESSRVDIQNVGDTPVSEVNDFYHKQKPKLVSDQPRAEMKNVHGQNKVEIKDAKEEQLNRFIKEMRAVGHTEQEILKKLKEKGWPSWQIEFALKKRK
ncbi:MAG: Ig-like domain-containing protein [Candidatus Woesearchaeota archaeon]